MVVSDEVNIEFDMFVAFRNHWIFDHFDARSVVFEHCSRPNLFESKFRSKSSDPNYFFCTECRSSVFRFRC